MTSEQLLLFPHLQVPARHLEWFRLANAGTYPERDAWFYPFKSRFLHAHALPDGFDVQVIVKKCWCGDGIFRGIDDLLPRALWQMCNRCGGSGVHRKDRVYLKRWLLGGRLYHQPVNRFELTCEPDDVRETIMGLIKHEPVNDKRARRALLCLLLRYEPRTAFAYLRARWRVLNRRGRALLNRLDRWLAESGPGEPEFGMGDMRYFCAPVGMIAPEKLPPKWGLIEWNGTRMKVIKKAERWQRRIGEGRERSLLVSALRRVAHDAPKGISVTCYTYETKCRASLGVAAENADLRQDADSAASQPKEMTNEK